MHALSDLGTLSILTLAPCAFRPKCRTAGRAVWPGISSRNRRDKEREANKKHQQKYRGKHYLPSSPVVCHVTFPLLVIFHASSLKPDFKQPPRDHPTDLSNPDKSKPVVFLRDRSHDEWP
jgi:hypothetical protein